MAVDAKSNLTLNTPRKSVRISSKQTMTKGQLLIMDAQHVPTGCSTWPAFVRCDGAELAHRRSGLSVWAPSGQMPARYVRAVAVALWAALTTFQDRHL